MAKYQQYDKYKDSGVDVLGSIPTQWKISKLAYTFLKANAGEVIDKTYWGSGKEVLYTCNKTPLLSDYIGFPEEKRTTENDLLLTRNGTPYVHKPIEGSIYSNVVQRITLSAEFDRNYLTYCLGNSALSLKGYGVSIESFNFETWKSMQFATPSMKEQKQVVNFLDYETAQIDTLIEKQQTLIQLLREKRQAVVSHAVTKGLNPDAPMKDSGVEWLGEVPEHWEVSKLKFVSDIIDCRNKTPEYFENGEYFVVRTTNVRHQKLNFNGALYTDKKNFDIWTQRGVPPAGSILFTREAPTGEVCLVPENLKFCMGQRMMNFIAHNESYTNYLFDYLISDCLDRYINSVSHGSTVTHLRVEQVQNIPVLVPPLEEIIQIHKHIEQLKLSFDNIELNAKKAIHLMQERRTALISAAVTGKIDVRGWRVPE